MEIIKLPSGERASNDADCISIQQLPGGGYSLNGSLLRRCSDDDPAESMALIGGDPYRSYEDAEAAGLAWASDHCVETLFISRSEGTKPLPELP
jgi:hypothetical protein